MVNFTILAGGYDLFIAAYLFNSNASSLSLIGQYPSGPNPSWISLHPTNKSILYATNEITEGAVQSFTVMPNGVLSEAVETVPSGGDTPAFVGVLSTGQVTVMNYVGANGRIIPTTDTPLDFDDTAGIISFPIPDGGASNPHMALEYGSEVLVPDLGGDTVWRLKENGSPGNWKIIGSIAQPAGSGPRHIAVEGDLLFTLHQTTSTLTVQKIPSLDTKTAPLLANVSIVPPDPPFNASFAAAELLIPKTSERFPVQYIYASNRNMGEADERGDTIAIFQYVGGKLELVTHVYTGLDQVRTMEFGGEDSEYLVAGGVARNGSVAVFRRVDEGRNLEEIVRNIDLPVRVSFVWL
ncbi:Lactonase, 7-bladed beta-propeller-domain-containing protein [Armillaria borealis]|uniref:Lactonase, 7-bladed beta-propeller-domain-containing protein n=1 Tax=Armillaria borealis TaxID=47425 RepID=A0AA39K5I9_9AGAR|nr:Lactonase, 7-bladed beta-propeller-domain-containing protein [Armillaria borealis]